MDEAVDVREVHAQQQCGPARIFVVRDLDHRGPVGGHAQRAAVHRGVEVDVFDARDRARREELQDRVPREGRTVGEPELEPAVGDQAATDRAGGRAAPAG